MLRNIRIVLAIVMFVGITLLFLDFTGTLYPWVGWMAKLQFLPAVLALNVIVVLVLLALTLLLGRVYCSVICPLGVMQDIISWISGKRKKKYRYRFKYKKENRILRYGTLAVFVVLMVAGLASIAALIAPYSSYGRIVQSLLQPVWIFCNNLLADYAEKQGSYAFYHKEIWMRSLYVLVVAAVTFVVLAVIAWRQGRLYCNTICPVGTVLGFFSRYAWLKPVIDTSRCNGCGKCGRGCKASCIDTKHHKIDYSRCVACMDCIGNCSQGAISFAHLPVSKAKADDTADTVDAGRRSFMATSALITTALAVEAKGKTVDGGLATILDKEVPKRKTRIVPAGAIGIKHLTDHCTACQLCVTACPNDVLRPSTQWGSLMQIEASYERGYCRPECTRCSEVCPSGAIKPITRAEKSATQIGHAVWVKKNCVVLADDVDCGNCARHCPAGAITMIPVKPGSDRKIPSVNTERCIGCGACENLCPARPLSAIYVEGHEVHRSV